MTIGKTVPLPCRQFKAHTFLSRKHCIFGSQEARMRQDIHPCLYGCPVCPLTYRLHHCFAMNQDKPCPQVPCPLYHLPYLPRGYMRQFHAWDNRYGGFQFIADIHYPLYHEINIRGIAVVSYGNCPVSYYLCPPHKLRGEQFAVTQQRMCMEVYHKDSRFTLQDSRCKLQHKTCNLQLVTCNLSLGRYILVLQEIAKE